MNTKFLHHKSELRLGCFIYGHEVAFLFYIIENLLWGLESE